MDLILQPLSKTTKIPSDQLLFIFVIVFNIALSFTYRFISSPKLKLWYSFILGMSLQYLLYGFQSIDMIVTNILNIILIFIIPRKYIGIAINLLITSHLFYIHISRMFDDYGAWKIEISFAYMTTYAKWSSYSHNLSDGENNETDSPYSIKEFNLLEYLSYVYFPPSCLIGPFSEYNDFVDFIYSKNNFKDIEYYNVRVLLKFIAGISILVVYSLTKDIITVYNFLGKYETILANPKSKSISEYLSMFFAYYVMIFYKIRFYVGFLLSECACDASGISFESKNRGTSESNSRVKNVRVIECETTIEIKNFFKCWNIAIHTWLKRYVFKRVVKNVGQQNAEVITFIYSCVWHGFYPSYYIVFSTFIFGQIAQIYIDLAVARINELQNFFAKYSIRIIFEIVYRTFFFTALSFVMICLELLKWDELKDFLKKTYYFPLLCLLGVFLIGFISRLLFGVKRTKSEKLNNSDNKIKPE